MSRAVLFLTFVRLLSAQAPPVGDINLYGFRKLSPERVLGALQIKPGDPLPGSKGDLEDRLEELPGVVLARVQAVCCDGSRAMLFVGLEERGAQHSAFRSEPAGNATLPDAILDLYHRFMQAVEVAGSRGDMAEDLSRGHSLMADPEARAIQLQLPEYASANLSNLREVLRNGPEPEQRAIAAGVIGYAPDKAAVVNDLQYALQDPDEAVRANAIRSLTAIAVLADKQPSLAIRVAPTWFVELLQSIVLSDRLKASEALVTLTEHNGAATVELLRERALPSLAEMARWKSLRYALPSFVLIGRLAGLSEDEIHTRWEKGDREAVIAQALREPRTAKKR
jgi:hypothetical protein